MGLSRVLVDWRTSQVKYFGKDFCTFWLKTKKGKPYDSSSKQSFPKIQIVKESPTLKKWKTVCLKLSLWKMFVPFNFNKLLHVNNERPACKWKTLLEFSWRFCHFRCFFYQFFYLRSKMWFMLQARWCFIYYLLDLGQHS